VFAQFDACELAVFVIGHKRLGLRGGQQQSAVTKSAAQQHHEVSHADLIRQNPVNVVCIGRKANLEPAVITPVLTGYFPELR
jgi:hypothetical protein